MHHSSSSCHFLQAIQNNNIELIRKLIAEGIDINQANQFNVTPLELALKLVSTEVVNILLLSGAKLRPCASSFYQFQVKWHMNNLQRPISALDYR